MLSKAIFYPVRSHYSILSILVTLTESNMKSMFNMFFPIPPLYAYNTVLDRKLMCIRRFVHSFVLPTSISQVLPLLRS